MTLRINWIPAVAGVALCFALSAHAAPLTVSQLMSVLAKNHRSTATFTETQYLSVLDHPVESSGELLFIAPAYLEKRTLKPQPETALLDGDTFTLQRGQHKYVVQLSHYPQVADRVEGIRATLAGDRKTLERVYHLKLNGTLDNWTLILTPLSPDVSAVVSRVELKGDNNTVRTVEILQADGDHSIMHIKTMTPKPSSNNP